MQYFYCNKLFSEQQYGYKKNSYTKIAALEMIDRVVRQLDQRDISINFYLDLSKAFDRINHKNTCCKVQALRHSWCCVEPDVKLST